MKVYKFGGASIATPLRAAALLPIISDLTDGGLVVISALGKTTNALEKVVEAAMAGDNHTAMQHAERIKADHMQYASELLHSYSLQLAKDRLAPHFDALSDAIERSARRYHDEVYDQIVCLGELLSTSIVSCYLAQEGINHQWIDARSVIETDSNYRDAAVNWEVTQKRVDELKATYLTKGVLILTQGFIGKGQNGNATTLGREGSDYTAAILAAMTHAESLTIWKDVPALLSADPKLFPDAVPIRKIAYREVIEMAFYGAQIIHPKTIKPLQNNNIPLYVRCFLDPSLAGTTICEQVAENSYPPLVVRKDNQLLIQVTTRDFSFITEENLSVIYQIFSQIRVKINLIQNAAISFIACVDNRPDKVAQLIAALTDTYDVRTNEEVSLLTVRHDDGIKFANLTAGRQILLQQNTRKTLQAVIK